MVGGQLQRRGRADHRFRAVFLLLDLLVDRQDANVAISFENKDNFERNMATLRIEERLALAIYRPEAFVKGVLESAS